MKRYIYVFLLFVTGVSVHAANYFVDGARWIIKGEAYSDDAEYEIMYSIEGTEEWLGENCLRLYKTSHGDESTKILMTMLHVDGEKVYFARSKNDETWTLLYDFGLEAGESCEVGVMTTDWSQASDIYFDELTCMGRIESDSHDGWTALRMRRNVGLEYDYCEGLWLDGIGGTGGLRDNSLYGMPGGAYTILAEFSVGDEVLCRTEVNNNSAIEVPESDGCEGAVRYFDLSGRSVARPDAPGVYITVRGADAGKLLVK